MRIRCLTLHQPWASLIARGEKTIETREWLHLPTWLVGQRLAIHASRRGADGAGDGYYHGVILCHALVADVRSLTGGDADRQAARCDCAGCVGIVLTDIIRLDSPIACRGHQGFFWVEIPSV